MEENTSSEFIPISPLPDCIKGHVNIVPSYITVIAGVTCALSILGAFFIITSYVCFKELRTRAREVIVHISAMDLLTAMANLIGIAINFDSRLSHNPLLPLPPHYHTYNKLCVAQATIAVFGNLSSILWTIAIAVYFYVCIMTEDNKTIKRSLYAFYVICYGLPILILVWFLPTGKIGFAPVAGSGWCSFVIDTKEDPEDAITQFFGNSLWLYVSFLLIPIICFSLIIYLRLKIKKDEISDQDKSRMTMIELKLLAVPLVFVLLRVWSELLAIIAVYTENTSCLLVTILLVLGGIGDSGQGFFNALIFCFFNRKVRKAYWMRIKDCYRPWKTFKCKRVEMESPLVVSENDTETEQ